MRLKCKPSTCQMTRHTNIFKLIDELVMNHCIKHLGIWDAIKKQAPKFKFLFGHTQFPHLPLLKMESICFKSSNSKNINHHYKWLLDANTGIGKGSHQKKGKKFHNSCELWGVSKFWCFLELIFKKKHAEINS